MALTSIAIVSATSGISIAISIPIVAISSSLSIAEGAIVTILIQQDEIIRLEELEGFVKFLSVVFTYVQLTLKTYVTVCQLWFAPS